MPEDKIDDVVIWTFEVLEARGIVKNRMATRRLPGFPKPVKLSARAIGWYAHEVRAWLANRPRVEYGEAA